MATNVQRYEKDKESVSIKKMLNMNALHQQCKRSFGVTSHIPRVTVNSKLEYITRLMNINRWQWLNVKIVFVVLMQPTANYFATHRHALLRICARLICVNADANCSEEAKCLYDKQVEHKSKYLWYRHLLDSAIELVCTAKYCCIPTMP